MMGEKLQENYFDFKIEEPLSEVGELLSDIKTFVPLIKE
jgi:hypothetical protein